MAYSANLAWLTIIIFIVLFIVFVIWVFNAPPGSEFGVYSDPVNGPCNNSSGLCNVPGERIVTRECIINEQTGKGCIGPDGEQTYDILVSSEPCTLTCRSAVWEDVTAVDEPCVIPGPLPGEDSRNGFYCLPTIDPTTGIPISGTRELTYRCIANDSSGVNNCTQLSLESLIGTDPPTRFSGPTGVDTCKELVNGVYMDVPCKTNVITTFNIGDEITIQEQCAIESDDNPVCGTWDYYTPFTPREQNVTSINQISACSFFSTIENAQFCDVPGGVNNPFALLQEGIGLDPMACIMGDAVTIPTAGEPELLSCLQSKDYIGCNDTGFSNTQIANKTLHTDLISNPFICNNAQNSSNVNNNPQCLRPCRLYPVTNFDLGNATFNALVNNPFLMYKGTNYLTAYQIPRTDNQLIKFSNSNTIPGQVLVNTPFLMVDFDFRTSGTRPTCNNQQTAFNTAVLGLLGPESVSGTTMQAKISTGISNQYLGWLTSDNFTGLGDLSAWQQGYAAYNGPGKTYEEATSYQITIISPFDNTPVTGYPNSIGQTTLQIRTTSNAKLKPVALNNGGTEEVFEAVTLIIFDYSTVNFDSRNNTSSSNCNLFNPTNLPGSGLLCSDLPRTRSVRSVTAPKTVKVGEIALLNSNRRKKHKRRRIANRK